MKKGMKIFRWNRGNRKLSIIRVVTIKYDSLGTIRFVTIC